MRGVQEPLWNEQHYRIDRAGVLGRGRVQGAGMTSARSAEHRRLPDFPKLSHERMHERPTV